MSIKVELHRRNFTRKDGKRIQYWTLRWWGTDGRRFSESIGTVGLMTKNEAETTRREKEQAIGGGRIKRNRPREITLAEFIELDREAVRGTVKPNTLESIKHSAAHALKAWGGATKLTSIGRPHFGRLKAYLLDEAKVAETTLGKTLRDPQGDTQPSPQGWPAPREPPRRRADAQVPVAEQTHLLAR